MKTKIIYVVTKGEYSDYCIVGACLNRKDAELLMDNFGGEQIEEIEDATPYIKAGWHLYNVYMKRDGTTTKFEQVVEPRSYDLDTGAEFWRRRDVPRGEPPQSHIELHVTCWAKTANHAVKIANERRAQLLAADAWGDNKALKRFPWCQKGIA